MLKLTMPCHCSLTERLEMRATVMSFFPRATTELACATPRASQRARRTRSPNGRRSPRSKRRSSFSPERCRCLRSSPPLRPPSRLSSTPKTFRGSRSSAGIRSSRHKLVVRNQAIEKVRKKCEDHFDAAGARGTHRTPCSVSFLCGRISCRWHQHKRHGVQLRLVAPAVSKWSSHCWQK